MLNYKFHEFFDTQWVSHRTTKIIKKLNTAEMIAYMHTKNILNLRFYFLFLIIFKLKNIKKGL